MHQTSSTYQKILSGPHRVETALQVGSNADVAVCWSIPGTVYGEDMITKIRQNGDILDREAPGIGYFVARKLEVTMLDPSKQVSTMGRLVPFSRLVSDSGVSEWIPKGIFYVDTKKNSMVDAQAATVDIVAYDAGLKASIDYDTSALSWPATDVQVVADIAGKIGAAYDVGNLTGGFSIAAPEDKTCCEVLRGIAALYGGNFAVDDCGVLRLIPLQTMGVPESVKAGKLKMGTLAAAISGVVLHDGDGNKYTVGSGEMLESESPWASQRAASQALSAVNGYRYQAFSARQAIIKPHMELGDYITVGAASGLMCSYYFDMGTYVGDVGAPEEYEINRKYPYRTTASRAAGVGRAAKRIAKQAVGNIIENYNQLIAALNGEDGVPEDLASGLKNYVRYDLKNGDMLATSKLFSEIGEKARAEITTYAYVDKDGNTHSLVDTIAKVDEDVSGLNLKVANVETDVGELQTASAELTTRVSGAEASLTQKAEKSTVTDLSGKVSTIETAQASLVARVDGAEASINLNAHNINGVASSVATIQADVVRLKGLTEVDGSLNVYGGNIYSKHDIEALTGTVVAKTVAASQNFLIGGTEFAPTQITSTSGAVRVLGIA